MKIQKPAPVSKLLLTGAGFCYSVLYFLVLVWHDEETGDEETNLYGRDDTNSNNLTCAEF